ncbi:MAG: alpha-amylase [Spirochaetales bacterium]|nr:alpha-amylase [Spirochaetales bacterium]
MRTPTMKNIVITFTELERGSVHTKVPTTPALYEFHVSKSARDLYGLSGAPFSSSSNVVFADFRESRAFADKINAKRSPGDPSLAIKAGAINAMALIDEILHAVCALYRERVEPSAFTLALDRARVEVGVPESRTALLAFTDSFPPSSVYDGAESSDSWLDGLSDGVGKGPVSLEELLLLRLENENPAFAPYRFLFDDRPLKATAPVEPVLDATEVALRNLRPLGPGGEDLLTLLRAPMRASPHSLAGQLAYMKQHWGMILGERMAKLLGSLDMLDEEERPSFPPGPGPVRAPSYESLDVEYERFSEDKDWMPRVVMMAKSTLVWLDQLSKAYGRDIHTLDAIPDEELDLLSSRGFNALWLIGIWERSQASRRIKELCGNPEAAPSAYSLFDYEIAWELGGWPALESLRHRAGQRGIRLAADMVPNHTGLDSAWVRDRPDLFIRRSDPPFPSYSYNGENLSADGSIGLWLEDHYYDRRDAAVTFKRVDFRSGETSYIYHGNDGTSMPWNDTAQLDFLNPATREAVKERILHVARNFPIIRFDAAMILAKRSFRRLWYPEPGAGGAIASRFESAISTERFNAAIPEEFWREVVDQCAMEAPETLLLAEAFWMMEGYFVRTLGMHRVYNSAFMNMLKDKKNAEYRATIKNTVEFDKDILKRFVNFMNNPDEETAVVQFGSGDHYFGVCSMMATMPGLPMFGHGQIEGFTEKYGMEYRRAYKDEHPDDGFIRRHEHEIFPLLKRRYLFSGVELFLLYDLVGEHGHVNENVFAYSNGYGHQRALVIFNNAWERTSGTLRRSCAFADKRPDGSRPTVTRSLAEGLGLSGGAGRFTVFTELKSGLRYIRRSNDIVRHGLSVALEGFQCQVFIDIAELSDDERGSYAALCDALAGAGVENLGWALQDMEFADLHRAWAATFDERFFQLALNDASLVEPTAENPDCTALAAFLEVASDFIERRVPSADAARVGAPKTTRKPRAKTGTKGAPGEDSARQKAAQACAAVASAIASLQQPVAAATGKRAQPFSLDTLANRLASTSGAREAMASLATLLPVVYAAESLAREAVDTRDLIDAWGLERKLREALVRAGSAEDVAGTAAAFAVAALPSLAYVRPGSASTLRLVSTTLSSDAKIRELLGVNAWDGVEWFNKERYKLASTLMAAAAVAIGGKNPSRVMKTLARIDAAAEASLWRVDLMIAALDDSDN